MLTQCLPPQLQQRCPPPDADAAGARCATDMVAPVLVQPSAARRPPQLGEAPPSPAPMPILKEASSEEKRQAQPRRVTGQHLDDTASSFSYRTGRPESVALCVMLWGEVKHIQQNPWPELACLEAGLQARERDLALGTGARQHLPASIHQRSRTLSGLSRRAS